MTETRPDPDSRYRDTRRATLVGAVVNLLLTAIKLVVGVLGHSQALVADGVHSLSDLLSDAMVYFAARHARQAADAEHPYGHGRFETVATLGLAGLLILVAVGIAWDAVKRMYVPESLLHPDAITLVAALLSVLSKEALYRYTMRVGRRLRSQMVKANAWHHRSDAVSSIVVLVGLAGARHGLPYLDAVAAAIVGLMIARIGWELGWGAVQELVDAGLDQKRLEEIRRIILSIGGVRDMHMLRTRRLGGAASLDVHVLVDPRSSVSEGHMISAIVEQRLKQEIEEIEDVTVHIDPEDDQRIAPSRGLPPRADALSLLERRWADIPGAESRERIVLHYIGGKIETEVFFPLSQLRDRESPERMRLILEQALDSVPAFGRVRVFYG